MKIMDTIGFLELNSIAKGIEVVDYMLKAADASELSWKILYYDLRKGGSD